jgi:hypothetical protein
MEAYNRSSHTVWDCKYHLVWTTKYRYPVLGGDVGVGCRELLRETALARKMAVHSSLLRPGDAIDRDIAVVVFLRSDDQPLSMSHTAHAPVTEIQSAQSHAREADKPEHAFSCLPNDI